MSGLITRADGQTFEFDVVVTEDFNPQNAVTDHPVEDGTVFSDHIQRKPLEFNVVGILSENPFQVGQNAQLTTTATRLADATSFLDIAGENLVTYESVRFGEIENLTLTSWKYTVDILNRLQFTVGFKEIRIAEARIIRIPPERLPPKKKADVPETKPCSHQPPKEEKDPSSDEVQNDGQLKSFAAEGRDRAAARDLLTESIAKLTA